MFNKASLFSALVLTASFVHARPGPTWVRRQENAQSSLTLDPAVISQGLAQDGQGNTPDPGQVRSETSTNNFINHCLKFLDQGVPLTDGKQITGGSCNQTPMGRIISLDKAPRCKFVFPKNGDDSIIENTAFTVQMRMVNMVAGNFVNAQANYYAAPQQVDGNGILIGHSHIVIEPLPSLDSTEPLDPLAFKFFKGLNDPADGQGILKTEVTAGLPKGVYRMCSINTAANHQPALVSNAQHGALDDCSYFTVKGRGELGNNNNGQNSNQNGGQNGNVASSSTEAGSTTQSGTAAPESTQSNQNSNQNGGQNVTNGNVASSSTEAGSTTQSGTAAPESTQGNQNGQSGQQGNNSGGQSNNTGAPTETPGSTSVPAPEQSQGNSNGAPTETPGSSSAPAPEPSQGNNEQQGNSPGAPTEAPGSTPAPAPAPEPSQSNPGQQGGQTPEQGNNGQQSGNPVQPGQENTSPAPEQPGQGPSGQTQPEQNQGQQPPQGQADPTSPPGQGSQGPQRRRSHHGRQ